MNRNSMLKSVLDIDFKELKIYHALGVNYLRGYEIHSGGWCGTIIIEKGGNRWSGNTIDIPYWFNEKISRVSESERDRLILNFAEDYLIRNEHNIRR